MSWQVWRPRWSGSLGKDTCVHITQETCGLFSGPRSLSRLFLPSLSLAALAQRGAASDPPVVPDSFTGLGRGHKREFGAISVFLAFSRCPRIGRRMEEEIKKKRLKMRTRILTGPGEYFHWVIL